MWYIFFIYKILTILTVKVEMTMFLYRLKRVHLFTKLSTIFKYNFFMLILLLIKSN